MTSEDIKHQLIIIKQAGRTSHAAGRTGAPKATAEGETSGQWEVC